MSHRKIYGILAAGLAVAVAGGAFATLNASASSQGGTLDDGKDLLPQARISLAEAVAAAQTAGNGAIGEVDLEYYQGKLVFNVDVGDSDVKVDASSGQVLGSGKD